MSEYEPGKCNIGGKEQRKRYFLGSAGFATAGIYIILSAVGNTPFSSNLLLFTLFFVGFNGFTQGKLKFCAGYGLLSRENTADDSEPEKISRNRIDMLESLRIQLYSLFGAIITTALANALVL